MILIKAKLLSEDKFRRFPEQFSLWGVHFLLWWVPISNDLKRKKKQLHWVGVTHQYKKRLSSQVWPNKRIAVVQNVVWRYISQCISPCCVSDCIATGQNIHANQCLSSKIETIPSINERSLLGLMSFTFFWMRQMTWHIYIYIILLWK